MAKEEPRTNDLLKQLEDVRALITVHWDETERLWSDELHEEFKKVYIDAIRDAIELCLRGINGPKRVYGAGLYEIIEFVDSALSHIKSLKTLKRLPDGTLKGNKNQYISQKEGYKRKYSERTEKEEMVDYDNY